MASNFSSDASENYFSFKETISKKELLDRARAELNETSERREEYLEKLRSLIRDHIMVCSTRDDFLLRFLRIRKFEIQPAFESLQSYVKIRGTLQKDFLKLQPEAMKKLFDLNILGFLPLRDDKGRYVLFYRSGIWTSEITSEKEIIMTVFAVLSYVAEDPMSQINGVQVIFDNKCFSMNTVTIVLRNINILKSFFLKCLPLSYRQMHCLGGSSLMKYVLQLSELILPEKLRKRILIHAPDNSETLFEHISLEILPTCFGGHYGLLSSDHMFAVMDDYLTRLKDEKYFLFEEENTTL